jgi:hypothetical protein
LWLKSANTTPPLHSHVGEGEGGCYLNDSEELLYKNTSYIKLSTKAQWKWQFNENL